jgi:hypothetical protein
MKKSLVVSLIIIVILITGVVGYFVSPTNRKTTTTQDYSSTIYSTVTAFRVEPITNTSTTTETNTSLIVSNLTKSVTSTEVSTSVISAPDIFSADGWSMTINDSFYPNQIAYNPNFDAIYLFDAPSNVITVIAASNRNLSNTFTEPEANANELITNPEANILVYLGDVCIAPQTTCSPADINTSVLEINGNTDAVMNAFSLPPPSLGSFAVNFATGILYETLSCPDPNATTVFNQAPSNCGFLYSYDLKSGSLLANTSLGVPPSNIIVDPQSNLIYIIAGDPFSQELLIIIGTTNRLQSETPLDFYFTGLSLQVNPNTNTVFVLGANANSTILTALNGSSGKIIYSSIIGSGCSIDTTEYSVDPLTNQIYATAYNETLNTNYLLIFNGTNGQLVNMLSTGAYAYVGSAFNPQANETYLLLQSTLSPPQILLPDQLVSLPTQMPQTYVDTSLLTSSSCNMIPVE